MTGQSIRSRWTAENSSPALFDWMVGSPPPEDRTIRFEDGTYFQYPQMRWSVCHFDQLVPTKRVSRGLSGPIPLRRKEMDGLDEATFVPLDAPCVQAACYAELVQDRQPGRRDEPIRPIQKCSAVCRQAEGLDAWSAAMSTRKELLCQIVPMD
jgi:hypothetical protein